jgi:hypothetical protein
MSFEFKVYTRDESKWCLLAGFKVREHALRFARFYQSQFREENEPLVKIHQGKRKILQF